MKGPLFVGVCTVLSGCSGGALSPSEVTTIVLSVVSGQGQAGAVGTALANPVVIRAADDRGRRIAGLTVEFVVTGGGGSVASGSAVTSGSGTAQGVWTLGTSTTGSQTLAAHAVLSAGQDETPAVFNATALAGPAAQILASGGPSQVAVRGTAVAFPPTVRVSDQYGNPVASHAVSFAVGAGGGSLTGATTITNTTGLATVGSWQLGPANGVNSLTATAAGTGIAGNPASISAIAADPWTTRAPLLTARHSFGVGVVNGILYAVGGVGVGGAALATVEAYDPATDAWVARAPMPTPRGALAVVTINGILYAVGGSSFSGLFSTLEAFDPVANTWTTRAPMPVGRSFHAAAVVNGILYVMGGAGFNLEIVKAVHAYDPATDIWSTKAPMPTERTWLSAAVVNSVIYAVGGFSEDALEPLVEAYDPATDSWISKPSLPTPQTAFGLAAVNGILYAMGGGIPFGSGASSVDAYDPATDSWRPWLPMLSARRAFQVGVVDGVLYAVGGATGVFTLTTNESWRP